MIRLETHLIWPGCAQGRYTVRAKGFILAVLHWGDHRRPLDGWGPFAYVPVDPAGNGAFSFPGRRGIPREATHVWARCYTPDFSSSAEACAGIPDRFLAGSLLPQGAQQFSVLTDLHLSSRPGKIRRALQSTESDTILLLGDSANDGLAEQFERFSDCLLEAAPGKTVFSVTGNHDILHPGSADAADGCRNYMDFQARLLERAAAGSHPVVYAPDGRTYSAQLGGLDLVGLQCVASGRSFTFPEGIQLDWLDEHLARTQAAWHILLCHAPLLAHNPHRDTGAPYLGGDRRLQEIVDRHGRILFLSGHTHISPNGLRGSGEYDEAHQNVYLDCGSVVATDMSGETGLMSPDWKDGCRTELSVSPGEIEICMRSVETGVIYPRGYYRFRAEGA